MHKKRRFFQAGFASASSSVTAAPETHAAAKPKTPGETKVVAFMGGDYGHNSVTLEMHIRQLFASRKDWWILFVRASRFFTPELISDADLLITSRHSRPDDIDWSPEGIVDSMKTGELLWTDENADAISLIM